MRTRTSVIAAGLLFAAWPLSASMADACDPWPNCAFDTKHNQEVSQEVVQRAKDNAAQKLQIFNKLNVLDISDEIVGSADIRALVGSYAYFEPDKKTLQIIGANFEGKLDRIQLKDRRLFEGVVRRGFDTGISLGVLKMGLKNNQVAELVIDDIAFASIEASADKISCNFPVAFREAALQNRIRPVFIKSAAISRIRKRYFTKSQVSGAGTYMIVSANGSFHVSDDTTITHFVITPQVVPARPASGSACDNKIALSPQPRDALAGDDRVRIEVRAANDDASLAIRQLEERLAAQEALTGDLTGAGAVMKIEGLKP